MIDPQRFRDVLSAFPTGVVVLTAFGDDGGPRGLTVSAFCAVSLHPPLVLVSIDKTSNTLPAVQQAGGFTANILAAGREALARRMATKLSDKFDGIAWRRPVASLNYLLSSHVWRQDHNGFSHQDPGFIDHVVNKKAEVIRVYLPPDANTLLSVADHCLRSRNYVNVIVAGKQMEQNLSLIHI